MTASGYGSFWIGLSDEATEGQYVWAQSGTLDTYLNWDAQYEPTGTTAENCVAMRSNGWFDMGCGNAAEALCEFPVN